MYRRFCELLTKSGKSVYQVSKETGIPQTTLASWKARSETDSSAALSFDGMVAIADYFGVSLDYFREEVQVGNTQ